MSQRGDAGAGAALIAGDAVPRTQQRKRAHAMVQAAARLRGSAREVTCDLRHPHGA
jgi:hypothetical protein